MPKRLMGENSGCSSLNFASWQREGSNVQEMTLDYLLRHTRADRREETPLNSK